MNGTGFFARFRARAQDERGFTMVEAMAAGMVLAIGVFAIAGAMTFGLSSTGLARQRTAAQTQAEQQLELARTLDYDQIRLKDDGSPIVQSTNPDDPDYWVTSGMPPTYDSDEGGPAPSEPLIIANATPSLLHYQANLVQGNTRFTVYTYVTWVDSPADGVGGTDLPDGNGDKVDEGTHDDKRVTVIVTYAKLTGGATYQLKMSSVFSDGKIPYRGFGGSGSNQPPSVLCPSPTLDNSQAAPTAASLSVDFTASASDPDGSVTEIIWDFGDGTPLVSGSGVYQSHTYAAPGTYTVVNTVYDDGSPAGAGSNASLGCRIEVQVPPSPVADITPPTGTIVIAGGATYTTSTQVTLTLSATDDSGSVAQMQFASVLSSEACSSFGAPIPYATSTLYTIPAAAAPLGDGDWKICVKYIDAAGNVSSPASDTILLDRVPPPAPSGLTVARAANKKSATLQWTEPSPKPGDFGGYQVWRKATTSSTWEQISCQYTFGLPNKCTDPDMDHQTNYEYYVVSVDFAGNQSAQSNHVTV